MLRLTHQQAQPFTPRPERVRASAQRVCGLPTNPPTVDNCQEPFFTPFQSLLRDNGGSLLLTYWPSEFSQIRGQLRRTHYGEGPWANEFVFQFMFSMGAHGAHPF